WFAGHRIWRASRNGSARSIRSNGRYSAGRDCRLRLSAATCRAHGHLSPREAASGNSCRRSVIVPEGAQNLVQIGRDRHFVVEKVLQPEIVVLLGDVEQRQKIAKADA